MVEHMNAFQGLINQTTSREVPLGDKVLALLLLGSLPDSLEMLVVTLGNVGPNSKHREPGIDSKAFVTKSDTNRGRGRNQSPQYWEKSGRGRSQGEAPPASTMGRRGSSKRTIDTSEGIKRELAVPNRRRFRRKEAHWQSRQPMKSCC